MNDALAKLNENASLLGVAFPRARNSATTTPNHATACATGAQQGALKALALLALARNTPRNSGATDPLKGAQQTPTLERAFVARVAADSDAVRARLLFLADAELIDPAIVRALPDSDVAECVGLDDATLRAYIRMLCDADLREHGKRPADETARALCRFCGPVLLHPAVAAVAPIVDGWPRVLGCPWCHVKNRKVVSRPAVTCGACENFSRDAINPDGGMGRCTAKRTASANEPMPFPHASRQCESHEPENAT